MGSGQPSRGSAKRPAAGSPRLSSSKRAKTSTSTYCEACRRHITNERSHKALCTRKEVICIYPPRSAGLGSETVILYRDGGNFRCVRCDHRLKKDQNMKEHARQCYGSLTMDRDREGNMESTSMQRSGAEDPRDCDLDQIHTSFTSRDVLDDPHTPQSIAAGACPTQSTPHASTDSCRVEDATANPTAESAVEDHQDNNSTRDADSILMGAREDTHVSQLTIADANMSGSSKSSAGHGLAEDTTEYGPTAENYLDNYQDNDPMADHMDSTPANVQAACFPPPAVGNTHPSQPSSPRMLAAPATSDRNESYTQSNAPNKFEAQIRAGPDSVTDDPVLLSTPYIVNTTHNVLICVDCKHSVEPDGSLLHIRTLHSQCRPPRALVAQLKKKYPGLRAEKIAPSATDPVFGLAIPLEEYVVCTNCRHGYLNVASWRSHTCKAGPQGRSSYFLSLVQTFFRGNKLRYFPITMPPCPLHEITDDFQLFQAQNSSLNTELHDEPVQAENYRELNQFLFREGWLGHVTGHPISELCDLVALPARNDALSPIAQEVFNLMSNIQVVIANAGFHARRLLGRRPSNNHDAACTTHHRDIQPESLKRYGIVITCLVAFVTRCQQGWPSGYHMLLTDNQANACRALQDELRCGSSHHLADKSWMTSSTDEDWQDYLENIIDLSEASDDEAFEDADGDEEPPSPTEGPLPASWDFVADTPLQVRILELLIALYTHLPRGGDDKFYSPIIRFVVLLSRQKHGQWALPRRITQFLAILLFCGRLVMMALMHRAVLTDPQIRYSQAYNAIASFLDDALEGPIPMLYLLMRPLNHLTSAEEATMQFTATDFTGRNIVVAGRVLYLDDIRHFIETLIGEIRTDIRTRLFFGLDILDVDWSPGIIHEEPRNVTIGYSCFNDPHNKFLCHKEDLLRAVLTHPQLRGHFHYLDELGHVRWKAGPCLAYMEVCHEVEMKLFSGTHTSVGEPGRATEFAAHIFSNVCGGSIRNTFILFQYLCFMGTFTKSSHLTEKNGIMMRVPHPEIGRLWITYLTFVRPLIVVWQQYFHGHKAANRAKTHLFFGPHRPVSGSELSRSLSYHTDRLLKFKISIRLWRHITTWFLNYHSVRFLYSTALSRQALAKQAGHNLASHSLYAADARLPGGLDFHDFFRTMHLSGAWHKLLGCSSNLLQDMSGSHVTGGFFRSQMDEASNHCQDRPFPSAEAIAETVKNTLLPEMVRIQTQTRANDLASLLDAIGYEFRSHAPHPLAMPVTHLVHPSRLRDLRKFLRNDLATFKSTQQAEATELIASKNPSLLLVGPTGSGKTLPLLLCVAFYDSGNTTVMILPLLAMHDEYRMRANRHGLSCTTWTFESEPTTSSQIVLIAVEACASDRVKMYVTTLIRTGRLARIAVDEAHLLLQHASFRPCLDMLEYFGQMPTSIVLMTATCPRHLEAELFKKVGRKIYQVLRRETDRPEIAQKMIPILSTDLEKVVAEKITSLTHNLDQKDRALLFCWSRDECDAMAALLNWKPYHSSVSVEERLHNKQQWMRGDIVGLVCTSMLNCCLDFPSVRYVFHLRPPRNGTDYYQAIGRCGRDGLPAHAIVYYNPASLLKMKNFAGNDWFGVNVMYDTLCDSLTCRRLRLGLFFDGVARPCAMIPGAQLCDVCEAQLLQNPPAAPMRFLDHLSPNYELEVSDHHHRRGGHQHCQVPVNGATDQTMSASTRYRTKLSLPEPNTNPSIHLAPSATFGNHFVAAQAATKHSATHLFTEQLRCIHTAVQILAKCCIYCWSQSKEYDAHRLQECPSYASQHSLSWKAWRRCLKLPAGCCLFCGCPLKMVYMSEAGQELQIHDHATDHTCHWASVFKPLAFIVFRDALLGQALQ